MIVVQVVEQFKQLQADTDQVLKILTEAEVTRQIQQSRCAEILFLDLNISRFILFRDSKQLLDFLVKGYDFKTSMIDTCYNFAKFQYECGNYSGASEYLYFHRILVQVSLHLQLTSPEWIDEISLLYLSVLCSAH